MTEPTIICPNCRTEIKLTESLAAPLIASTRQQFEAQLAQKDRDIAQRENAMREKEKALTDAKRDLDEQVAALDTAICGITTKLVDVPLPLARTAYYQLATWIGGVPRANAVELFTPNYDLLLEQGLEAGQIPYFDGFIGSKQAFFDLTSMEAEGEKALPDRWALFDNRLIRGDEPWKCLVIPHGLVRDDKRKVDCMSFATVVKQKRHRKVA